MADFSPILKEVKVLNSSIYLMCSCLPIVWMVTCTKLCTKNIYIFCPHICIYKPSSPPSTGAYRLSATLSLVCLYDSESAPPGTCKKESVSRQFFNFQFSFFIFSFFHFYLFIFSFFHFSIFSFSFCGLTTKKKELFLRLT